MRERLSGPLCAPVVPGQWPLCTLCHVSALSRRDWLAGTVTVSWHYAGAGVQPAQRAGTWETGPDRSVADSGAWNGRTGYILGTGEVAETDEPGISLSNGTE